MAKETVRKNKRWNKYVVNTVVLIICFIPSLIYSVHGLSGVKMPNETDDVNFAVEIWNNGITNVPYKSFRLNIESEDDGNSFFDSKGFSDIANTNSTLDIILKNGDELIFNRNRVKVLSAFLLSKNTQYCTIEFIENGTYIKSSIWPLIFDILKWMLLCIVVFPFCTFIIIFIIWCAISSIKEVRKR